MGVHDLWSIIGASCDTISLDKLRGRAIAIDLSGWAVDSQCLASANAAQPKMYLRNLFFRTSALLMQGTLPVFVLEGAVPELKQRVIAERLNIRDGKDKNAEKKNGKLQRSKFNNMLRECERLLNLMGLTCIRAHGEAEAMCAHLNEDGLVDGCITQDGDCFLYGAKTIYRKFALAGHAGSGRTVEEYTLEKVEKMYKIGRQKLIALALLCGCDYTPGVPGVGKVSALKFFSLVEDDKILRRLKSWQHDRSKASTKEEEAVKSKCLLVDDFPNQEVIDEFTLRKGTVPTKIDTWQYPNGVQLTEFLMQNLAWEVDAAFDKVLPLVTRWQVVNFKSLPREIQMKLPNAVVPARITKIKKLQAIASFEIEWDISAHSEYSTLLHDAESETPVTKEYATIEPQAEVRETYPNLAEEFEESRIKLKKPAKTQRGKEKASEDIDQPVKPKKSRAKKTESSSKKINDYFKEIKLRKPNESKASEQSAKLDSYSKNAPNKQVIKNCPSKLDDTLNNIYEDLRPEDFDSNVDADSAEMSAIIERTCSYINKFTSPILVEHTELHDLDEQTPETSPITSKPNESEILDISSDEDIVYVPISDRIKARR